MKIVFISNQQNILDRFTISMQKIGKEMSNEPKNVEILTDAFAIQVGKCFEST